MTNELEIPYRIDFSAKRKTVAFIVERNADLVVKAPIGFSTDTIAELVKKNRMQLYQKINHPQKIRATQENPIQLNGRSILFGGKNYKAFIDKESTNKFFFNGKFIISENISDQFSGKLSHWLISEAKEKLTPKIIEFAKKLGVEYNKITITDIQLRWGSCTPKNNISINYRIIKAPAFVSNYIIVHELTHLIELNHTKEFWQIVRTAYPKYDEAKKWLLEKGELLFRE
jgi:predicted metal-dependent hydrolase